MEIDISMLGSEKYGKDFLSWIMGKIQRINLTLNDKELGSDDKCDFIKGIIKEPLTVSDLFE